MKSFPQTSRSIPRTALPSRLRSLLRSSPLSLSLSRVGGALLLSVASAACSGVAGTAAPAAPAAAPPGAPSKTAAAQAAAPAPLLQQLQAAIGDAACDSSDQCRTIAVGSKACGGPERYLPWSAKRSDGATLGRLAEQYAAARRIEDAKSGMMSTCELLMDPGAVCQQQRCVLQPRGPGAGGAPVR